MKGWSLEDIRSLDIDDYEEIVLWLNEQNDRAQHGDDSTNADAIVEAKLAKERMKRATDGR